MSGFTHLDDEGNAVMVDVSAKSETERIATARGSVIMAPETMALIVAGQVKKGDVLSVAQLAGIMGAKRTPDLVPLCHPLNLTSVKVDLICDPDRNAVDITACCKLMGQTGVDATQNVANLSYGFVIQYLVSPHITKKKLSSTFVTRI